MTVSMRNPMWKLAGNASYEPLPNTALCDAFMAAIMDWYAREAGARRVVLPSGTVDASELRKVVCALVCARGETAQR